MHTHTHMCVCMGARVCVRVCGIQHTPCEFADVGPVSAFAIQHHSLSAYVSIRQHTSAYVSIRQRTSADVSRRQQTSAYVSIRQHTSHAEPYKDTYSSSL